MLGLKFFDNTDALTLGAILALAQRDKLALELAVYNGRGIDSVQRLSAMDEYMQIKRKSLHLNYRLYTGSSLSTPDEVAGFEFEMWVARSLGISECVLHYFHRPDKAVGLEALSQPELSDNLHRLAQLADRRGVRIYIENTLIERRWDPCNRLEVMRSIWDTILEHGLQTHLGMCLDWGHVKAFTGGESMTVWLDYARQLFNAGLPMYMHIHTNDGQKDQHWSIPQGLELGCEGSKHPDDAPFLDLLACSQKIYESSPLILEYDAQRAVQDYLWTKRELQGRPA